MKELRLGGLFFRLLPACIMFALLDALARPIAPVLVEVAEQDVYLQLDAAAPIDRGNRRRGRAAGFTHSEETKRKTARPTK